MKTSPAPALPEIGDAIDAYYRGDWTFEQLQTYAERASLHPLDRRRLDDVLQWGAGLAECQKVADSPQFQEKASRLRQRLLDAAAKRPATVRLSDKARTSLVLLASGQALAAQQGGDGPPTRLVEACRIDSQPIGEGAPGLKLGRYVSAEPASGQDATQARSWRLYVSVAPASRVVGVACGKQPLAPVRPGLYTLELRGTFAERIKRVLTACSVECTLTLASGATLVVDFE
jgi:hypothetical protein